MYPTNYIWENKSKNVMDISSKTTTYIYTNANQNIKYSVENIFELRKEK